MTAAVLTALTGDDSVAQELVPTIAILLCTYNGQSFLEEQLASLEAQTYSNWRLIVSDDGSTDLTLPILKRYQSKWPTGKMIICSGPQKGFGQNFLSLICDPKIGAQYYAFCDQDDVWLPEKLAIALEVIEKNQSVNIPFLYCARTQYVDDQLAPCGQSPLFLRPPSFRNALVQSIAGGNTMVINRAAKRLLETVRPVKISLHDWWVYQLISGAGGHVFYDPRPSLLYRQHAGAQVGGAHSFFSPIKTLVRVSSGLFRQQSEENRAALKQVELLITQDHQAVLNRVEAMTGASFIKRLRLLCLCGLYRQTLVGTLGLYLAILLNRA